MKLLKFNKTLIVREDCFKGCMVRKVSNIDFVVCVMLDKGHIDIDATRTSNREEGIKELDRVMRDVETIVIVQGSKANDKIKGG